MTTPPQDVGAQWTAEQLNARAVFLAKLWALAASGSADLFLYVNKTGPNGLQEAGFGGTESVAAFTAGAGYLNTLAAIFTGDAAQPSDFNFSDALALFIGPQPEA